MMAAKLSVLGALALSVCAFLGDSRSLPGRAATSAETAVVFGGAPQCAELKGTYQTYCSSNCGTASAKEFTVDSNQVTAVDTFMCDSVSTCTSLMPSGNSCSGS